MVSEYAIPSSARSARTPCYSCRRASLAPSHVRRSTKQVTAGKLWSLCHSIRVEFKKTILEASFSLTISKISGWSGSRSPPSVFLVCRSARRRRHDLSGGGLAGWET